MNEDAGTAWQGNEWVDAEGRPRDAQAAGAWKGNQWVDEHGKPRKPDEPSASVAASGGASASGDQQPEWQGNRWVDKQGHQIGDWGNAPDWKTASRAATGTHLPIPPLRPLPRPILRTLPARKAVKAAANGKAIAG